MTPALTKIGRRAGEKEMILPLATKRARKKSPRNPSANSMTAQLPVLVTAKTARPPVNVTSPGTVKNDRLLVLVTGPGTVNDQRTASETKATTEEGGKAAHGVIEGGKAVRDQIVNANEAETKRSELQNENKMILRRRLRKRQNS